MPDSATPNSDTPRAGLNRSGIRSIVVQTIILLLSYIILFISAGTLVWINGWVFVGLTSITWIVHIVVLARVNPEVLNARGSVVKKDTKGFDRINAVIVPLLTIIGVVVMALDAARFHWTSMPFWLSILGIALIIFAVAVGTWAMAVNKFMEWTARIQNDRQQYVITSGPYGIVRHPAYTGYIIERFAYPLILGSWWGLLPEGILAIIFVIRTVMEDRTLQKELPGYFKYTQKVKYRLIPLIW